MEHHRSLDDLGHRDGKLIIADDAGRPDFYALGRRMLATTSAPLAHLKCRPTVTFVAFDLLWLDGSPLVDRTYTERRERLEELALAGPCWTTTPSYRGIAAEDVLAVCVALAWGAYWSRAYRAPTGGSQPSLGDYVQTSSRRHRRRPLLTIHG